MKRIVFVFALLITSWSFASLTDGLVGYWPFDGDAKDYSGNGNHGVTHGVSLKADRDGRSNCAYSFGEGDYITVPANSQLNAISDFTLCALIKPSSWDNGYWLPIMCKGTTRQYGLEIVDDGCQDLIYHAEEELHVSIDHDYKSCFEFYYEGNGFLCTSHKLRLGEWTHIAATRSNGHLSVYINGTKIGSATGVNPPASDVGALNIGRDPPGGMEYFHGVMDELFLYNRALSSSEIFDLYNGALKVCKLTFDANGGSGTMPSLSVLSGTQEKLPENAFRRHDGYVFQGWASNSVERANNGIVDYKDEALITVNSDMTLYAVWANPALTLAAESANWSSGSITLRCEDGDLDGTEHEYTLEYKNASEAWEEVDGAKNKLATRGQNASGQAVLVVQLTDNAFWSRLGGLPPVEYRVKDENGRVSEGRVTRTRYGLSVGFSKYGTSATSHPQSLADAMLFKTLALSKASCLNVELLKNNEATISGIHGAFVRWSGIVKPGDVFFFYIATHGGYNGTRAGLTAYDGLYEVSSLVSDSSLMPAGSLFLGVVMSCHSRAMVDYSDSDPEKFWYQVRNGLAQCRANSAWISSCGYDESSYNSPTSSQTAFGEWFLEKGWQNGFADAALHGLDYSGGNGDGSLTLQELANYAHAFSKGISDDNPSEMYWENGNNTLLGMVVLDASCHYQNIEVPNLPTNVSASQGDTKIDLSWAKVGSATSYRVYRYPLDLPSEFKWIGISGESRYKDATTALKKEYGYRIRAVNPIGVSDLSSVAIGSRGTSKFIEFLNSFFGITTASADEYDAMEKTTAANGCRTLGECYELGIDPEDPNDDLKIAEFKMKDGKPEITLNHTKDGSGNSFEGRVKILGKAELSDAEWQEVPPEGNPAHRFFKVGVEMP